MPVIIVGGNKSAQRKIPHGEHAEQTERSLDRLISRLSAAPTCHQVSLDGVLM